MPQAASMASRTWNRTVRLLLIAGFLAYALNFLYFFVDDEAISYVYAQNLLSGRGLVYNADEGRVEGYSNFLHVLSGSLLLAAVNALGISKLGVFAAGKLVSLIAGAALVALTHAMLTRLPGMRAGGIAAAIALLAFTGPLAVWSCSSLETVTAALIFGALTWHLLREPDRPSARGYAGGALAVLAILERIDGFIYVGVLVGAFWLFGDAPRRRALLRRVALPAALTFAVYHGWRFWYFGEWLPMPVHAKLAYKLTPFAHLATKPPGTSYVAGFLRLFHWIPLLALAAPWTPMSGSLRRIVAPWTALIVLSAYVAFVGDWMFGYRLFVALLPLAGLLVAVVVSSVIDWNRLAGGALAVAVAVSCVITAMSFERGYEELKWRQSWLTHPSLDPARFFAPYYELAVQMQDMVRPGELIATNQAGLVPFLLDVRNIDDLGICSRFYAKLPTSDLWFTEVGRYQPLTNRAALRAGEAYLLYREPRFIVVRANLVRAGNRGHTPETVLNGTYREAFRDPHGHSVVYARTKKRIDAFRREPTRFLENLVHPSHLLDVALNGAPVPPRVSATDLRFFWEGRRGHRVDGTWELDARFSQGDVDVYELHAQEIYPAAPAAVVLRVLSASGATSWESRLDLGARERRPFHLRFDRPIRGCRFVLRVTGVHGASMDLVLDDVAVMGQRPALARYIAQELVFPAPDRVAR